MSKLIELVFTNDNYIACQREIERAIGSVDFSKPVRVTVFVENTPDPSKGVEE